VCCRQTLFLHFLLLPFLHRQIHLKACFTLLLPLCRVRSQGLLYFTDALLRTRSISLICSPQFHTILPLDNTYRSTSQPSNLRYLYNSLLRKYVEEAVLRSFALATLSGSYTYPSLIHRRPFYFVIHCSSRLLRRTCCHPRPFISSSFPFSLLFSSTSTSPHQSTRFPEHALLLVSNLFSCTLFEHTFSGTASLNILHRTSRSTHYSAIFDVAQDEVSHDSCCHLGWLCRSRHGRST
jgi:hypothetical protein